MPSQRVAYVIGAPSSIVMLQSNDDISLLAPAIDVVVRRDDLLERKAPINNGFEFSRRGQLRQKA